MINSLSVKEGRVSLYVDLPEAVMTPEVYEALQELKPHFMKLAKVLDAYQGHTDHAA